MEAMVLTMLKQEKVSKSEIFTGLILNHKLCLEGWFPNSFASSTLKDVSTMKTILDGNLVPNLCISMKICTRKEEI